MLKTAQIGASGVLLIQYRLLKCGIDSAPMTTDYGIDLVAYDSDRKIIKTVQVKTNLKPKPAGGKGALALDWYLERGCPAELIALVNLEDDQAWLLPCEEFAEKAQQRTGENWHLYFYTDPDYKAQEGRHLREFEPFRIERQIPTLFRSK